MKEMQFAFWIMVFVYDWLPYAGWQPQKPSITKILNGVVFLIPFGTILFPNKDGRKTYEQKTRTMRGLTIQQNSIKLHSRFYNCNVLGKLQSYAGQIEKISKIFKDRKNIVS